MKRILMFSSVALLLTALFVPSADARGDQYTISHLTFSGAFQLPGVTLPPGTYTFKRVAPGVIQVLSRNHQTLYGTFMTVPTLRSERTVKPEVVFGEAPVGEAPPIVTWFPFPEPAWFNYHRSVGYEFLY
jgi:hypothetical protein